MDSFFDFSLIFSFEIFGNTLRDYVLFMVFLIIGGIFAKLTDIFIKDWAKKYAEKTETKLDDIVVHSLELPLVVLVFAFFFWFSTSYLNFDGFEAYQPIRSAIIGIMVSISMVLFAMKIIDGLIDEYIQPLTEKTSTKLDNQLLPIVKKMSKVGIITIVLLIFLQNMGFDVGAVLAGLGIGGLAVAMASKDTIENLISGILIIMDKPFMVDDTVNINGIEGSVTEIGMRSTRIKTYAGTIVTIPNSKISNSQVENITKRPARRVDITIGLVYQTKPEDMKKAKEIIEKILKKNKYVMDNYLIVFDKFSSSSMDIFARFWMNTDFATFMKEKDNINLEILEKFNKNKLDFAYPTQTVFVKK